MSADGAADASRHARQRRAFWLRQMHTWHWISSAVSLIGLLLFTVTGITLNHAAQIEASPKVATIEAVLPAEQLSRLREAQADGAAGAVPDEIRDWLSTALSSHVDDRAAEWSEDEIYLSMPRPGGDAWLSIDLASGAVSYERTDRGWISYLNDLHKGRNAGEVWRWFIDVFAVACLVFCLTGLVLLKLHARHRPSTWPVVGLGLLLPVLLLLLFIH